MIVAERAARITAQAELSDARAEAANAQADLPDHLPRERVVIAAPQTLSGAVSVTPDKTINAVVSSGYGLGVMSY